MRVSVFPPLESAFLPTRLLKRNTDDRNNFVKPEFDALDLIAVMPPFWVWLGVALVIAWVLGFLLYASR
jgi:hypothetical protein